MIHTALLGYSVAPTVLVSGLILLARVPVWAATLLEIFAVLYSSAAAVLCYFTIYDGSRATLRLNMLSPGILLMHIYIISLLPIHFH